jgi:hypothetical protein
MRTQERKQSKWMVRIAGAGLVAMLTALVTIVAAHRGRVPRRPTGPDWHDDPVAGPTEGRGMPPSTRYHHAGSPPRSATEPAYAATLPETSGSAEAKAGPPPAPSESERLAHAEAAFEAQVYDKSWAQPSRRIVEERLALFPEPSAHPGPVKCRSTLCRLDVAVSGGTATAESYLTKLVRGRLWDGPAMFIRTVPDSDGRVTLTLFLAKEDSVLPEPSALATM